VPGAMERRCLSPVAALTAAAAVALFLAGG